MITETDKQMGKRIQRLRKKVGLTQEQLAEKVSLSTKFIQFIETAHRKPSLKSLQKIARALKTDIKNFF